MKNAIKFFAIIALVAVIGFGMTACNKSGSSSGGGGKTFKSAEELKAYLGKQPVNGPNNPIQVTMNANAPMLKDISKAINASGKYVSLSFSGDTLTAIPNYAFSDGAGNEMLINVTIPDGVTSIGDGAFLECTNLTNITIPTSVASIGEAAFKDCTSLTNVTIPNGVTSIGYYAFYGCTSLANITIPDSITTIEGSAFFECTSLTSVTIPDSVTSIMSSAFGNCTSLTAIDVDSGNTAYSSVDGVLYNKNKTLLHTYPAGKAETTFTIPNGVISIEYRAFIFCTNLTSVTIPDSVTNIGGQAFWYTGLTSVKFERVGITLGSNAFINADNTTSLQTAYTAGGIGTYTRPDTSSTTWTKQN